MRFLVFYLLSTLSEHCSGDLNRNNLHQQCRDNENKPVDWWYLYKPPADVLPPHSGANFTFVTPDTGGHWLLSPVDILHRNMLSRTLQPKFRRSSTNTVGRAIAIFQSQYDRDTKRQTSARGVVVADQQGGFLLTHSVPGFAADKNSLFAFPPRELKNGHLISCVSLDLDALNKAVTAIKESAPNITFSYIPETLSHLLPEWDFHSPFATLRYNPSIYHLIRGNGTGVIRDAHETMVTIVARAPDVKSCIYMTFAARQQIMMNVYGQSRNSYLTTICSNRFGVRNLEYLCLKFQGPDGVVVYYVTNSTDYSWFGVSTAARWQRLGGGPQQFWVCTSLVDKEVPGDGGLLLCVQNYELWVAFDNLKLAEPTCDYNES